jgi:hypothetical protein
VKGLPLFARPPIRSRVGRFAARVPGLAFGLALDVHPRVAMQILRHSKISITMEIYTMVADKATLAVLKRLSDALSSPDAVLPDEAE